MERLEARAERLKFERLLHLEDGELAFLESLASREVRPVRERVSDLLHDHGAAHFERLVAASRLLPTPVVAGIAQRVFPPVICAQMAGSLDPEQAAALIRHMDPSFVAELSEHVDPRAVAHLIPVLPDDVMVRVAVEINRREDHLTAGRLVVHAPDRVLPRFIAAIEAERDLLQIAFFLEDWNRLDAIVSHIPDDRLERLVAAAHDDGLWQQALALAAHLSDEQASRIATATARAPQDVRASLLATVIREDLWHALLPVVAQVEDDLLPAIANLPELRDAAVLHAILDAVTEPDDWEVLVRVVVAMDDSARAGIAEALPALTDEQSRSLVDAASRLSVAADDLAVLGVDPAS